MILRSSLWPTPCPVQHRFYWPVLPCARQGDWIVDPLIQRGDNQRKSEPKGSSRGDCRQRLPPVPVGPSHTREQESNHESNCAFSARVSGRLERSGLVRGALSHRAGGQESGKPQSLFNGKDLTGWVTPDDKSLFSVENGEIVGRTQGEPQEERVSGHREALRRFRAQGQGQVQQRQLGNPVPQQAAADGAVSGPQADVADGYWGLLYEERGRGILERYPEDKAKELVKNDDWNEFVITAKGKHVTIDFNGTRIIDRTDEKFDEEGIIALQIHVWPVPWRSASRTSRSPSWKTEDSGRRNRSGSCPGSIDFVRLPRNRSPLRASGSYPRASSAKPGETHLIEISGEPLRGTGTDRCGLVRGILKVLGQKADN